MIQYQETAALQPLLKQFPTQIISENIPKNSEFSNGIRDLQFKNPDNHQSVALRWADFSRTGVTS